MFVAALIGVYGDRMLTIRAGCFWLESRWDSRIGRILIQPVGWAEASRNAKAIFARLA
jgi:hypothetical protein